MHNFHEQKFSCQDHKTAQNVVERNYRCGIQWNSSIVDTLGTG